MDALGNSNVNVLDHFVQADKMVEIGFGVKRKQVDLIEKTIHYIE